MPDKAAPFAFTPHHVGIVVTDLEAAMKAYSASLGYNFFQFEVNEENATLSGSSATFSLRFGLGQLGLSFVELIQPLAGTTLYSQHLTEKGPGIHHVAYSTADLASARNEFAGRGYPCLQNGSIRGLVDFSYYEAKELGCVVEPLQLSANFFAFLLHNSAPYPAPTSAQPRK
jgi:methylmalonyl-CoA/ethylmalonyl-CoA epimerase